MDLKRCFWHLYCNLKTKTGKKASNVIPLCQWYCHCIFERTRRLQGPQPLDPYCTVSPHKVGTAYAQGTSAKFTLFRCKSGVCGKSCTYATYLLTETYKRPHKESWMLKVSHHGNNLSSRSQSGCSISQMILAGCCCSPALLTQAAH